MSEKQCQVCSRDISKPSLVRCQATSCPLQQEKPPASRQTLVGIFALGLALVGGIAGVSWMFTAPGARPAIVPTQFTRTNVNNWVDKMLSARAPDTPAAAPQSDGVDWGASARVETFSCSGQLSMARSAICTNWDLATVDYNLALVYRQALAKAPNPAALRAEHERWLAGLDQLEATPDAVLAHYRAELEKLQAVDREIATN